MDVIDEGMTGRLVLDDPDDARAAALLLASGAAVAHGFANIYAITARSEAATVRRVNRMKGRPLDQVGSLTAPPDQVIGQFDLSGLPSGLTAEQVVGIVDALQSVGPIGFRGPAASHVPAHLTARVDGVDTTQVIVPGTGCPSVGFLSQSWTATGGVPLFITSANRSRHATGAADAPAHWRAAPLRAELAGAAGLVFLEHADDDLAVARFPLHLPTSTTILGLHRTVVVAGDLCLPVERHGSLAVDDVRTVLAGLGLGVTVTDASRDRLRPRTYDAKVQAQAQAG